MKTISSFERDGLSHMYFTCFVIHVFQTLSQNGDIEFLSEALSLPNERIE